MPQWLIVGGLLGAAAGAGIAFWLDGKSDDLVGPALRLVPIGAVVGVLARIALLAINRNKAQ